MVKKTNAKRILAAALAGTMALSLSTYGEQGGDPPTESASTAAVSAEAKAGAESTAESQDSGKNDEGATGDAGRPEVVSWED